MKTIKIRELKSPPTLSPKQPTFFPQMSLITKLLVDEEQTVVFVEVHYDKDNEEQKQAVHDIDDIINDYVDEEDEEESEDDE